MSIFPTFSRSKTPAPSSDYWYMPYGSLGQTGSGVYVNEETAVKYLTVFACVSLIGGDVGRLPYITYRRLPDGSKERLPDHPLYTIMHDGPNPDTDAFHWRETVMAHLLLWGNHYSFIERDNAGRILALWQIPSPGQVRVRRNSVGELIYQYPENGKLITRRSDEIYHIAGFGFNGLKGMSMLSVAQEAIGMGLAAEQFGARFFGQGTHPGAVVELDGFLGDNKADYVKGLKEGYQGLGKTHEVMVLEGGAQWKNLSMPLNDAQFLETRDHQKVEICGMYHVPPHKIAIHGQNSNYNNLEQENSSYVDSCLMSWLVRHEMSARMQLLSDREKRSGVFFEFLVDGLLRGDSAARGEFYGKLFGLGAITPNEIRSKENMNRLEDDAADKSYLMLNLVPMDKMDEMTQPPVMPGAGGGQDDDLDDADDEATERASRSIATRDRITRRFAGLIRNAAQAIINREALAIKREVKRRENASRQSMKPMYEWLKDFYFDMRPVVREKMAPVLDPLLRMLRDESLKELGHVPDDVQLDDFIRDYIEGYVSRHVDKSMGDLVPLLAQQMEALVERVDHWYEDRAADIEQNETTRTSNAMYLAVAFALGHRATWRIRGPHTCRYCKQLNGKTISKGQAFVEDQGVVSIGKEKMKINGRKQHPPLHRGCDCFLSA